MLIPSCTVFAGPPVPDKNFVSDSSEVDLASHAAEGASPNLPPRNTDR